MKHRMDRANSLTLPVQTQYDLSSTTYSPDGKIFQTEYAQKAVDNGRCEEEMRSRDAQLDLTTPRHLRLCSTVIGLRCKDGVVLAVEKLVISKLLVEGSNRRIYNADRHVGVVRTALNWHA